MGRGNADATTNLSSRLSTAPGSTSSRASFPNLRALCGPTFALPPSKNPRIGSWPPWITSTKTPSFTRGPIRSTTQLEYDSNFRNDDLDLTGSLDSALAAIELHTRAVCRHIREAT